MRFRDCFNPTEAELRAWAADPESVEPHQEWDLILSWGMDRGRLRIFIQLASDLSMPRRPYAVMVLYSWVSYIARQENFDSWKSEYDLWLEEARGAGDPHVKRWRHRAKLLFQGVEAFDYHSWSAGLPQFRKSGE